MTNRGVLNGLSSELTWQVFSPGVPILVASSAVNNAVQPLLADSTVITRYRFDRQVGRCTYQGYIQFSANASFGSAPFAYNVLLPFPCARDLGGADLLVGSGYLSQGSNGSRFVPLRIVQSDPEAPVGTANNTSYQEDAYIQFFVEHNTVTGTGSITTGNTSTTITHNLGSTPNAEDILIVPTNNPTTNPSYWYITGLSSTQFVVNVHVNPSTSGFNFSYKVSNEGLLVTDSRPWPMAANYVLAWTVEYQARR